jgi:hypothetical protein
VQVLGQDKWQMAKYRIAIALLCGSGFASFVLLLLKVSPAVIISVILSLILTPGGVLADLLLRPKEFSTPLAALAANALVYSSVVLIIVFVLFRNSSVTTMRLATIRLAIPALALVGLACVPAFNPLWPRGMPELARQERELQEGLPLGTAVDHARSFLQSKGIQFQEEVETAQTVVLDDAMGKRITAVPGDRAVFARVETDASEFPCGYRIQIVLLFGEDAKMKERHIQRLRICL